VAKDITNINGLSQQRRVSFTNKNDWYSCLQKKIEPNKLSYNQLHVNSQLVSANPLCYSIIVSLSMFLFPASGA
jgi:hypothetical protein